MTKEPFGAHAIRVALQKLPLAFIRRAMPAFDHPPRLDYAPQGDDRCGCWVTTAAYGCISVDELPNCPAWQPVANLVGSKGERDLSFAYENHFDWFKGECIREIAERSRSRKGAALKAKIAAAKT